MKETYSAFSTTRGICAMGVGDKRKRNEYGVAESEEETVQQSSSVSVGLKFNDFDKLREEAEFKVGQTWSLYDSVDGMPRLYAQIRKVSAPSFKLRITYLKPDPDHENEILWCEEELPISVGKFRLDKSKNIKERSLFSHRLKCVDGSKTGHLTVLPRIGETWALFKNWDIDWSKKPASHRKYEYEIVVVLSDYPVGAGVSVAYLHKAKGFASLFFRMGTGKADRFCILPQCLYRFSHIIPSFKTTGLEGKGVPKDAYELDQAALPEAIEEINIPLYLFPEPQPKAFEFPMGGKVIQTGQIWAFYDYRYDDNLPRSYCRVQKVSFTQAFEEASVFKLHLRPLIATKFPENVIQWVDKGMPVCCGTFSARKGNLVIDCDSLLSHQIEPQTSMDGNEFTILPKIGQVWATYRLWNCEDMVFELIYLDYDIVLVLDDTSDYKVLALEVFSSEDEEENTVFRAADSRPPGCDNADGPEVIFTIPKSKLLRFSHQIPASRITKEIDGETKEIFKVDHRALPTNVKL